MFYILTMGQISFRIPEEEMVFLKWLSEKTAQPVSSIFRNAILEYFQEWKNNYLLREYQKGNIGFKQMCNLGGISFHRGLILLEENNVEPPITEIIDNWTSQVREKMTAKDIFKEGTRVKRESPEVILEEDSDTTE